MLTIRLLGPLHLDINGEPVGSFRSSKALALFIYLAHTGQPHPREILADLLWDSSSTGQALSNLRTVLTQLRPKLGDYLLSEGSTLAFNAALPHRLDTAVLQTELAALPNQLTGLNAARLETALQAYQGDFLEDFLVRQADRFNEWVLIERERLRRQVLVAWQQLTHFFLQENDYAAAIRAATHWLALDELDEAAHRSLMQALALSGQRSAALQQYETCLALLEDELGVLPEDLTEELAEQIRGGQLTAPQTQQAASTTTAPVKTIAIPGQTAVPHNLNFTPFTFFGRTAEKAETVAALQAPGQRLLTITGAGGMGKTRLALVTAVHCLNHHAELFPHGLYFLSLAALDGAAEIPTVLASELDIQLKPQGERPLSDQLIRHLQEQNLLLVLDNVEHLLGSGGRDFVRAMLAGVPGLTLLLTSREPLELDSETVLQLDGWTLPPDTAVALNAPAAQLFQQAVRRVQPSFNLTPADAPALRQLCRWLMGLPLALELAGAWADTLSLEEMVAEIEQNVDFLEALSADRPDRQRSLRAVFNTTWQRLTTAEQSLWSRLALFRNGFTFEAAHNAFNASRPLLARLVKKSLLQFDRDQERYSLHALLQQFGREKLPDEAAAESREMLSHYYCTWLGSQLTNLHGGAQQETAVALLADWQNIRRAWFQACANKQIGRLAVAAEPFNHFCLWRGNHLEAIEALQAASKATHGVETVAAQRFRARLLTWLALHHYEIGQQDKHWELSVEAEAILQQPILSTAETRFEWAFLRREQAKQWRHGDLARAESAYQESIQLFHELGETWQESISLAWLGDVVGRQHDWPRLTQITQQMLGLQEQLGDRRGMSFSLMRLAQQALRQLKINKAEELIRRALKMSQELAETELVAQTLHALGIILLRDGRFTAGEAALKESQALVADVSGDHVLMKDNLYMLGFSALWQQDFGRAEHIFRRALAVGEQAQVATTTADSLGFLGWSNLLAGKLDQAIEYMMKAAAGGDKTRQRNRQRWANPLGLAYLHQGDYTQAADWAAVAPTRIDAGPLQLGLLALDERPSSDQHAALQALVSNFRQRSSRPNFPDLGETVGMASITAAHLHFVEEGWLWTCEVLQKALETKQWLLLLYGLAATAQLHIHAEAFEEAAHLLPQIERFPLLQASRWFDDVVRQPVGTAVQVLPPAQRAALHAKGQRQDPWETAAALLKKLA